MSASATGTRVVNPTTDGGPGSNQHPGGGGGGGQGGDPGYTTPGAPGPTGAELGYVGPYEWDQPLAQQAYNDALTQINQQRGQTYLNYGVDPSGHVIDPSAMPGGIFQQTMRQNEVGQEQLHSGIHNRGFLGGGLEGQAESEGQRAAAVSNESVANNLLSANQQLGNASNQALDAYNQRLFQDRVNSVAYAQQNNLYTPAGEQRSAADVKQMLSRAAAAWVKMFGSLDAKNGHGQTFQDRINGYGASALYDPSKQLRFAGQMFGGT